MVILWGGGEYRESINVTKEGSGLSGSKNAFLALVFQSLINLVIHQSFFLSSNYLTKK